MLEETTQAVTEELIKLCVNQDPAPSTDSGIKKIAQAVKEDIVGEQKDDEDLQFLYECTHKQLQPLVKWIVYDPEDGKKRLRENLSKQKGFTSNYKYHAKRLVPQIIDEIHGFGSNVIISGNHYREILEKVCDKLSVNYHTHSSQPNGWK